MSINQKFLVTAVGSALYGLALALFVPFTGIVPGTVAAGVGGALIAAVVILAFPDETPEPQVTYIEK